MSLTTNQTEHLKDDSKQALQKQNQTKLNEMQSQQSIKQSVDQLNQTIKQLKDAISSEGSSRKQNFSHKDEDNNSGNEEKFAEGTAMFKILQKWHKQSKKFDRKTLKQFHELNKSIIDNNERDIIKYLKQINQTQKSFSEKQIKQATFQAKNKQTVNKTQQISSSVKSDSKQYQKLKKYLDDITKSASQGNYQAKNLLEQFSQADPTQLKNAADALKQLETIAADCGTSLQTIGMKFKANSKFCNIFNKSMEDGYNSVKKSRQQYNKVPQSLFAIGTTISKTAGFLSDLYNKFDGTITKTIQFRRNISTISAANSDLLPGGAKQLDDLRKNMNLTMQQTVAFASAVQGLRGTTYSVNDLTKAMQGMRDTIGQVDIQKLKLLPSIMQNVPKQQLDAFTSGQMGADTTNAIINMQKTGQLQNVLDVGASGAFGQTFAKASGTQISQGDKNYVDAKRFIETKKQTIQNSASQYGTQSGLANKMVYGNAVNSVIGGVEGVMTSVGSALGGMKALKDMTVGSKQSQIQEQISDKAQQINQKTDEISSNTNETKEGVEKLKQPIQKVDQSQQQLSKIVESFRRQQQSFGDRTLNVERSILSGVNEILKVVSQGKKSGKDDNDNQKGGKDKKGKTDSNKSDNKNGGKSTQQYNQDKQITTSKKQKSTASKPTTTPIEKTPSSQPTADVSASESEQSGGIMDTVEDVRSIGRSGKKLAKGGKKIFRGVKDIFRGKFRSGFRRIGLGGKQAFGGIKQISSAGKSISGAAKGAKAVGTVGKAAKVATTAGKTISTVSKVGRFAGMAAKALKVGTGIARFASVGLKAIPVVGQVAAVLMALGQGAMNVAGDFKAAKKMMDKVGIQKKYQKSSTDFSGNWGNMAKSFGHGLLQSVTFGLYKQNSYDKQQRQLDMAANDQTKFSVQYFKKSYQAQKQIQKAQEANIKRNQKNAQFYDHMVKKMDAIVKGQFTQMQTMLYQSSLMQMQNSYLIGMSDAMYNMAKNKAIDNASESFRIQSQKLQEAKSSIIGNTNLDASLRQTMLAQVTQKQIQLRLKYLQNLQKSFEMSNIPSVIQNRLNQQFNKDRIDIHDMAGVNISQLLVENITSGLKSVSEMIKQQGNNASQIVKLQQKEQDNLITSLKNSQASLRTSFRNSAAQAIDNLSFKEQDWNGYDRFTVKQFTNGSDQLAETLAGLKSMAKSSIWSQIHRVQDGRFIIDHSSTMADTYGDSDKKITFDKMKEQISAAVRAGNYGEARKILQLLKNVNANRKKSGKGANADTEAVLAQIQSGINRAQEEDKILAPEGVKLGAYQQSSSKLTEERARHLMTTDAEFKKQMEARGAVKDGKIDVAIAKRAYRDMQIKKVGESTKELINGSEAFKDGMKKFKEKYGRDFKIDSVQDQMALAQIVQASDVDYGANKTDVEQFDKALLQWSNNGEQKSDADALQKTMNGATAKFTKALQKQDLTLQQRKIIQSGQQAAKIFQNKAAFQALDEKKQRQILDQIKAANSMIQQINSSNLKGRDLKALNAVLANYNLNRQSKQASKLLVEGFSDFTKNFKDQLSQLDNVIAILNSSFTVQKEMLKLQQLQTSQQVKGWQGKNIAGDVVAQFKQIQKVRDTKVSMIDDVLQGLKQGGKIYEAYKSIGTSGQETAKKLTSELKLGNITVGKSQDGKYIGIEQNLTQMFDLAKKINQQKDEDKKASMKAELERKSSLNIQAVKKAYGVGADGKTKDTRKQTEYDMIIKAMQQAKTLSLTYAAAGNKMEKARMQLLNQRNAAQIQQINSLKQFVSQMQTAVQSLKSFALSLQEYNLQQSLGILKKDFGNDRDVANIATQMVDVSNEKYEEQMKRQKEIAEALKKEAEESRSKYQSDSSQKNRQEMLATQAGYNAALGKLKSLQIEKQQKAAAHIRSGMQAITNKYSTRRQSVDIAQDYAHNVAGTTQQWYRLENQKIRLMADQVDGLRSLINSQQFLTLSTEDQAKIRNQLARKQLQLQKQRIGAQRSVFEKQLGMIMGNMQQQGAFRGFNKAAIFGAGYGINEAGYASQNKDKKTTGFNMRSALADNRFGSPGSVEDVMTAPGRVINARSTSTNAQDTGGTSSSGKNTAPSGSNNASSSAGKTTPPTDTKTTSDSRTSSSTENNGGKSTSAPSTKTETPSKRPAAPTTKGATTDSGTVNGTSSSKVDFKTKLDRSVAKIDEQYKTQISEIDAYYDANQEQEIGRVRGDIVEKQRRKNKSDRDVVYKKLLDARANVVERLKALAFMNSQSVDDKNIPKSLDPVNMQMGRVYHEKRKKMYQALLKQRDQLQKKGRDASAFTTQIAKMDEQFELNKLTGGAYFAQKAMTARQGTVGSLTEEQKKAARERVEHQQREEALQIVKQEQAQKKRQIKAQYQLKRIRKIIDTVGSETGYQLGDVMSPSAHTKQERQQIIQGIDNQVLAVRKKIETGDISQQQGENALAELMHHRNKVTQMQKISKMSNADILKSLLTYVIDIDQLIARGAGGFGGGFNNSSLVDSAYNIKGQKQDASKKGKTTSEVTTYTVGEKRGSGYVIKEKDKKASQQKKQEQPKAVETKAAIASTPSVESSSSSEKVQASVPPVPTAPPQSSSTTDSPSTQTDSSERLGSYTSDSVDSATPQSESESERLWKQYLKKRNKTREARKKIDRFMIDRGYGEMSDYDYDDQGNRVIGGGRARMLQQYAWALKLGFKATQGLLTGEGQHRTFITAESYRKLLTEQDEALKKYRDAKRKEEASSSSSSASPVNSADTSANVRKDAGKTKPKPTPKLKQVSVGTPQGRGIIRDANRDQTGTSVVSQADMDYLATLPSKTEAQQKKPTQRPLTAEDQKRQQAQFSQMTQQQLAQEAGAAGAVEGSGIVGVKDDGEFGSSPLSPAGGSMFGNRSNGSGMKIDVTLVLDKEILAKKVVDMVNAGISSGKINTYGGGTGNQHTAR